MEDGVRLRPRARERRRDGEASEHGRSRPDTVDGERRRSPPLKGVSAWSPVLRSIGSRKRRGGGKLHAGSDGDLFSAAVVQPGSSLFRIGSAHDRRRRPEAPPDPGLSMPGQPRDRPRRTSGSWAQDAFPTQRDGEKCSGGVNRGAFAGVAQGANPGNYWKWAGFGRRVRGFFLLSQGEKEEGWMTNGPASPISPA